MKKYIIIISTLIAIPLIVIAYNKIIIKYFYAYIGLVNSKYIILKKHYHHKYIFKEPVSTIEYNGIKHECTPYIFLQHTNGYILNYINQFQSTNNIVIADVGKKQVLISKDISRYFMKTIFNNLIAINDINIFTNDSVFSIYSNCTIVRHSHYYLLITTNSNYIKVYGNTATK